MIPLQNTGRQTAVANSVLLGFTYDENISLYFKA